MRRGCASRRFPGDRRGQPRLGFCPCLVEAEERPGVWPEELLSRLPLSILRSQQQAEILALLLGDPDLELSLTQIATRTGAPHPSVHREIERAELAGLVATRKVGNVRLARADTGSPYYDGLSEVLTRAFGVPAVLARALGPVAGICAAYIFGSWAARHQGEIGRRPVGDVDVLVLGEPDRDHLYTVLGDAEQRLGREVQVAIRAARWLESGTGTFHATVASRPMLQLAFQQATQCGSQTPAP